MEERNPSREEILQRIGMYIQKINYAVECHGCTVELSNTSLKSIAENLALAAVELEKARYQHEAKSVN